MTDLNIQLRKDRSRLYSIVEDDFAVTSQANRPDFLTKTEIQFRHKLHTVARPIVLSISYARVKRHFRPCSFHFHEKYIVIAF